MAFAGVVTESSGLPDQPPMKGPAVYDLALSADQERLRSELPLIAKEKLRPLALAAEAAQSLPVELGQVLGSLSWLPGTDAFVSGTDDPLSFAMAAEGVAWADPAMALAWVTSRQVAWIIAACGTAEQKAAHLPRLAESPVAPARLLMFEGFGRGPSELETRAVRRDGQWVISGEKTAVVFAGSASPSIVIARTDEGELVGFVVDDLGDAVVFEGTGDRRLSAGAISFAPKAIIDGLVVNDADQLLSAGLADALRVARLAQAAISLGASEATTRYAAAWGTDRTAFGRPLVGFQGVSFVLADLFMEIETVRLALWQNITTQSAGDHAELEDASSRVVAQVNHLFRNASREGIELMGVHGVITDHPAERVYRSAAVLASIDFDPLLAPLVLSR